MSLLQDLGYVYLVITEEGREYSFDNPYAAWTELETLNVAGRIEYVSNLTHDVIPVFTRDADGHWTDVTPAPAEEGQP